MLHCWVLIIDPECVDQLNVAAGEAGAHLMTLSEASTTAAQ